jgi:hypothetical protein
LLPRPAQHGVDVTRDERVYGKLEVAKAIAYGVTARRKNHLGHQSERCFPTLFRLVRRDTNVLQDLDQLHQHRASRGANRPASTWRGPVFLLLCESAQSNQRPSEHTLGAGGPRGPEQMPPLGRRERLDRRTDVSRRLGGPGDVRIDDVGRGLQKTGTLKGTDQLTESWEGSRRDVRAEDRSEVAFLGRGQRAGRLASRRST